MIPKVLYPLAPFVKVFRGWFLSDHLVRLSSSRITCFYARPDSRPTFSFYLQVFNPGRKFSENLSYSADAPFLFKAIRFPTTLLAQILVQRTKCVGCDLSFKTGGEALQRFHTDLGIARGLQQVSCFLKPGCGFFILFFSNFALHQPQHCPQFLNLLSDAMDRLGVFALAEAFKSFLDAFTTQTANALLNPFFSLKFKCHRLSFQDGWICFCFHGSELSKNAESS